MKFNQMKSKDLIERLKSGDRCAFSQVYCRYYDTLFVYLSRFSTNKHEKEDSIHEVFLTLWEKRNDLHIHSSLSSYLSKSVYYNFMDTYRQKKIKNKCIAIIQNESKQSYIEIDSTDYQEKLDKVMIAVDGLPAKRKEIFLLNKYYGYKYKEIANSLNISVKTVENQLRFAKKKLIESAMQ